jgi:hypothetical protein
MKCIENDNMYIIKKIEKLEHIYVIILYIVLLPLLFTFYFFLSELYLFLKYSI